MTIVSFSVKYPRNKLEGFFQNIKIFFFLTPWYFNILCFSKRPKTFYSVSMILFVFESTKVLLWSITKCFSS